MRENSGVEARRAEVPSPERWRVGFAVLGEGQQAPSRQLGRLMDRCKLPQHPKSNSVNFGLKFWHLVAT